MKAKDVPLDGFDLSERGMTEFPVKTLQMHVVHYVTTRAWKQTKKDVRSDRVLCDECEKELNFADLEENVRNELLS